MKKHICMLGCVMLGALVACSSGSTSSSGEPPVVLIRPEVECPFSLAAVRRRSLMNASTSSAVAASSSTFFTSVDSPLIVSGDTLSLSLPFIISGDTPAVCLFSSI